MVMRMQGHRSPHTFLVESKMVQHFGKQSGRPLRSSTHGYNITQQSLSCIYSRQMKSRIHIKIVSI